MEFGDAVRSAVTSWFGGGGGEERPSKESRRTSVGKGPSPIRPRPEQCPFSSDQSKWLGSALADSLGRFGAHVEGRIKNVEGEAQHARHEAAEALAAARTLQEEMSRLREGSTPVDKEVVAREAREALSQAAKVWEEKWKRDEEEAAQRRKSEEAERQEKMKKEFEEARRGQPAAAGSRRGGAEDIPVERRTLARMGGIGWDTPSEELQRRAEEVLQLAKVEHLTVEVALVTGRSGDGSTAQVLFVSPEGLMQAKMAIKRLNKRYDDVRREVWLDVQKTAAELRPGRLVMKVAE